MSRSYPCLSAAVIGMVALVWPADASAQASVASVEIATGVTISSVMPAGGVVSGGTSVAVLGTGFSTDPGATVITFGGAPATDVVCVSSTACQVTSPATNVSGPVSIRATVSGETSPDTDADDFAYGGRVYFLAEGATGTFFDEDILIANGNSNDAPVTITFFKDNGSTITQKRTIPAQSRATIHVDDIPGLEATVASTQITSTAGYQLAIERSMFWDQSYYAGHLSAAVLAADTRAWFAEGAQGFFDTYVLVNNTYVTPADVTFRFLRDGEPPVSRTVTVPGTSRYTLAASEIPELQTRTFGIAVEATHRVVAERAMYFGTTASRLWGGGTASPSSQLNARWFFAEGATGSFFDTFFLVSNPTTTDTVLTLTYLLDSGEAVVARKPLPAMQRVTINPKDDEDPRLRSATFATVIVADGNTPVVAERSMYWPGKTPPWGEAHNSLGLLFPGPTWDLAEGRAGGDHDFHTYILVANRESTTSDVTVTYLLESGAPVVKTYTVPPTSRLTIDTSDVPELANSSFGARVTTTNDVPIFVEHAMYWNANGVFWSGGSAGTAMRVELQ